MVDEPAPWAPSPLPPSLLSLDGWLDGVEAALASTFAGVGPLEGTSVR